MVLKTTGCQRNISLPDTGSYYGIRISIWNVAVHVMRTNFVIAKMYIPVGRCMLCNICKV